MKICAHTLVKNEERYVWYAVMSVLPYVDRMILADTGSTDNTVNILKEIKKANSSKVDLQELGGVSITEFTEVRNKMLAETHEDWILIVDGDEVWWDTSIKETIGVMRGRRDLETLVHSYYNIVGDIYHYQHPKAHHYNVDGKVGALNIRAISTKIPGLSVQKPHGSQGYYDKNNVLIQERNKKRRLHINPEAYLHFTHMPRAGSIRSENLVPKRAQKYKYELGIPFPPDFYYPEVFFRERPEVVDSVWEKRSSNYFVRSAVETLPKILRRKFMRIPEGY